MGGIRSVTMRLNIGNVRRSRPVSLHDITMEGYDMNKLAVSLLAGAAALVAGSAQAAPLNPVAPTLDNGIENVRMVCDQYGRCWRERGSRRVIIQRELV